MSTIYIRPYPVDNGATDYMVVVKPNPGGQVNKFEIASKADATAYANELAATYGFQVEDQAP